MLNMSEGNFQLLKKDHCQREFRKTGVAHRCCWLWRKTRRITVPSVVPLQLSPSDLPTALLVQWVCTRSTLSRHQFPCNKHPLHKNMETVTESA